MKVATLTSESSNDLNVGRLCPTNGSLQVILYAYANLHRSPSWISHRWYALASCDNFDRVFINYNFQTCFIDSSKFFKGPYNFFHGLYLFKL